MARTPPAINMMDLTASVTFFLLSEPAIEENIPVSFSCLIFFISFLMILTSEEIFVNIFVFTELFISLTSWRILPVLDSMSDNIFI